MIAGAKIAKNNQIIEEMKRKLRKLFKIVLRGALAKAFQ